MGRYYNGDIEGKFWVAVQSSTAADRFGVCYNEPNVVEYHYGQEDLVGVEEELNNIETTLGEYLPKFIKFFEENNSYTDEKLGKAGFPTEERKSLFGSGLVIDCPLMSEYADYTLGIKIRDCIKETGTCFFEAEL